MGCVKAFPGGMTQSLLVIYTSGTCKSMYVPFAVSGPPCMDNTRAKAKPTIEWVSISPP